MLRNPCAGSSVRGFPICLNTCTVRSCEVAVQSVVSDANKRHGQIFRYVLSLAVPSVGSDGIKEGQTTYNYSNIRSGR